jgi:hypothetical protein
MKLRAVHLSILSIFVVALSMLFASFVSIVKADPLPGDYFYYSASSATLKSCSTTGFSFTITDFVNLSFPVNVTTTPTVNGVSIPGVSYSQPTFNHQSFVVTYFQTDVSSAFPTQSGPYTVVSRSLATYASGPNAGQAFFDATWTIFCDPGTGTGTWSYVLGGGTESTSTTSCVFPDAGDGRLNSLCDDAAQSATFYCTTVNNTQILSVFSVWNSKGTENFKVTQADLDKFPSKPTTNTLINAGKFASLYRLTSGELQVNTYAGNAYVFHGTPATIAQICSSIGQAYYKIDAIKE